MRLRLFLPATKQRGRHGGAWWGRSRSIRVMVTLPAASLWLTFSEKKNEKITSQPKQHISYKRTFDKQFPIGEQATNERIEKNPGSMLRTTLRRVQLSPRSAVSPFVCIFCQKKGPNLERRLTTKDVRQSNPVEPPPTTKTSASSLKKSESVMDILRKDMLERKEGWSRKQSAKKAKAAEKRESKKAKAAGKKEPKKSKAGKKKGVSLFEAEAAVARSPKKKKALQVCLLSLLFIQVEKCVANFA